VHAKATRFVYRARKKGPAATNGLEDASANNKVTPYVFRVSAINLYWELVDAK